MQTQTSNALYNAIMEAGSKDRPPMLALGNYVQWKSRIKRYIDTKPNHELIHYCLQNPPYKYKWVDKEVLTIEAIQIILTRIDNDIYSTIDACPNACEMWKAIESVHPEQSKYVNDTYSIKKDEHNVIIDSLDMNYAREQIDQDDDYDLDNVRELLASLIEKLKCEIDDIKNRNKFLETSNKALVNKLKELDRRNDVKYVSKVEIDCAKAKGDLILYKMESQKSFNAYTQQINDLNQMILEMKKELFAHQDTIFILTQQKEAQIKLYKTRKDKELEKVIALENKVKVLDNIVYKTGQSVQTMNMLNRNCKTSFAKPEFLKKAQRVNHRLYDIGCYNDNLALMLSPESNEVIRLEKESRSKLSDLIRPFDYEKLNNLYDLFVPQCEKSSTQRYFSKRSRMSHTPFNNEYSKESFNKQTNLLEKRMDESIP
nr:hypothetical protein [Tanacetum cinerariifolium]